VISALIQCLNDPAESIKKATLDALQAVTGKKMSASRRPTAGLIKPGVAGSPERLIEKWQKWWQAELSG
jgi:hypothetical protein